MIVLGLCDAKLVEALVPPERVVQVLENLGVELLPAEASPLVALEHLPFGGAGEVLQVLIRVATGDDRRRVLE